MHKSLLSQEVRFLKGIGPKRADVLQQIGINTVLQLLEYLPRKYIDRTNIQNIKDVKMDEETTLIGEVVSIHLQPGRKKRLVVTLKDDTGYLQGIWFHGVTFFKDLFEEGQLVSFSGKISYYGGWQILHPDYDILGEEIDRSKFVNTGMIIPVYATSENLKKRGLTSLKFRKIFKIFFDNYPDIQDIIPVDLSSKLPLSYPDAIREAHFPTSDDHLKKAIYTLKYAEHLMIQILVALRRFQFKMLHVAPPFSSRPQLTKKFVNGLPYQLTAAQKKVLKEIWQNLESDVPMRRLIQGDVGSGKTIVAFITMLYAVENGFQAVLMAPTEILADQHYINAKKLFHSLAIEICIIKGGMPAAEKKQISSAIAEGKVSLIIGTHALIQENISFAKLGLAVIDEQHRFGVLQRESLISKGSHPHVLVMTATPIPRTITMTVYGDLDVSIIDELPAGRKKIKTVLRDSAAMDKIYDFISAQIAEGFQAYIVYPLIEESKKLDLEAAENGYVVIKKRFKSNVVSLIHGRLKVEEKDRIMNSFNSGETQILIATTVVEVGVDVANATVMLIQNAERYGLSQLHQLRGRVGRGKAQSYCILVRSSNVTEDARQRLEAMNRTNDGFEIAELDWQIRGTGEFFGVKQSGFDDLKIANLVKDQKILMIARKDALEIVEKDPQLRDPLHTGIKNIFLQKYRDKIQDVNPH